MEITKDTRIASLLAEYGGLAEMLEVFGVKRVARIHRVPLDEFLGLVRQAHGFPPCPSAGPIFRQLRGGAHLSAGAPACLPGADGWLNAGEIREAAARQRGRRP